MTEKGAAAGITLDQVIGKSQRSDAASTGLEQNRYILDAFFGRNEQSTSRPDWLTSCNQPLSMRKRPKKWDWLKLNGNSWENSVLVRV